MGEPARVVLEVPLRGHTQESVHDRRERENEEAVGGMRSPAHSLRHVPRAEDFAARVRPVLEAHLTAHSDVLTFIESLLRGQPLMDPSELPSGLKGPALAELCLKLAQALGVSPCCPGRLNSGLMDAFHRIGGDPDGDVSKWAGGGAPLGIVHHLKPSPIFPKVDELAPASYLDIERISASPEGWTNYRSAEDDLEVCHDLLGRMVEKGWAVAVPTWGELTDQLGSDQIPINRLGLITKARPDGSLKHRIVWDLRRSLVNSLVRQGERIILPRLSDVVDDAHALAAENPPGSLRVLGTDIEDAFHQVPILPDEYAFTVAYVGGVFYYFRVLIFGAASAPTVWGRFGSWLGRAVSAISNPTLLRLQVYVDDPLFTVGGPWLSAIWQLGSALLFSVSAGYPLAWAKTLGGHSLQWIGAVIRLDDDSVVIAIPQDRVKALVDVLRLVLSLRIIGKKRLRSIVGKLNFVAGLVVRLRAFLRPAWAVLAQPPAATVPDGCVTTRGLRASFGWLLAFFLGVHGPLEMGHPYCTGTSPLVYTIVTDACPWGMGGVLYQEGRPVSYWADFLRDADLTRYSASRGDPAHNTLWEALAALISFRLWSSRFTHFTPVAFRSDNTGVLTALSKRSAPAESLNSIMQEWALDEAQATYPIRYLQHIPGVSNVVADALSRLWAPDPSELPPSLANVPRVHIDNRTSTFYRVHHS